MKAKLLLLVSVMLLVGCASKSPHLVELPRKTVQTEAPGYFQTELDRLIETFNRDSIDLPSEPTN